MAVGKGVGITVRLPLCARGARALAEEHDPCGKRVHGEGDQTSDCRPGSFLETGLIR